MSAELISQSLGGRRSGAGFRIPSVCHGGKDKNLYICNAPDGKLLATCHSHGCEYKDIMRVLEDMGLKEKTPFKPDMVTARKHNRLQVQDSLIIELYVLLQYLEARVIGRQLINDKTYIKENPAYTLPPDEPWERELLAVKRIKTGLKILYNRESKQYE